METNAKLPVSIWNSLLQKFKRHFFREKKPRQKLSLEIIEKWKIDELFKTQSVFCCRTFVDVVVFAVLVSDDRPVLACQSQRMHLFGVETQTKRVWVLRSQNVYLNFPRIERLWWLLLFNAPTKSHHRRSQLSISLCLCELGLCAVCLYATVVHNTFFTSVIFWRNHSTWDCWTASIALLCFIFLWRTNVLM